MARSVNDFDMDEHQSEAFEAENKAHRKLFASMMAHAVEDLEFLPPRSRNGHKNATNKTLYHRMQKINAAIRHASDSYQWFLYPGDDTAYTFVAICEFLNIDQYAARAKATELYKKYQGLREIEKQAIRDAVRWNEAAEKLGGFSCR